MSRKTPVRVIRSGLTGTVYALTRYRQREDGLITVIGEGKHDVTADVELLVTERCAPLVEAAEALLGMPGHPRVIWGMDWDAAWDKLRDALAVYHAAQGAGSKT